MFLLLNAGGASAAPIQVFETNFNGALASEISPGTATLTGVQGYAGLGPAGNQFGGNFLRSETGNTVTLSPTGLPAHDTITLEFLFAAIDSLDGTGSFPSGDFFKIGLRRRDAVQRVVCERAAVADSKLRSAPRRGACAACRSRLYRPRQLLHG